MHWSITQSTAPAAEPILTATVKEHLRVDTSDDDDYIAGLQKAARKRVEKLTGRQLITATWKLYIDEFPTNAIVVPRPPLRSVTSIEYVDTDGVPQTWSDDEYRVDAISEPGRITEAYSYTWPTTRDVTNAVIVTYSAGYGSSGGSVPDDLIHAIKLLVGHWYENRESVTTEGVPRRVPDTVRDVLYDYTVHAFADMYPGY